MSKIKKLLKMDSIIKLTKDSQDVDNGAAEIRFAVKRKNK